MVDLFGNACGSETGEIIRVRRRDLIDGYHPPPEDPALPA